MSEARVWMEKVMIPTYEIGEAEKNPIFLPKIFLQLSPKKSLDMEPLLGFISGL